MKAPRRGNCYVTSEALYHLLGGKTAGWVPVRARVRGKTHWWLMNRDLGFILDATLKQFTTWKEQRAFYLKGRAGGFLTRKPSKRAKALMEKMLWQ